jgi:hypothetical protein
MKTRLLLVIFVVSFAYFVWPTRYKHYAAGEGPYAPQVGEVASRVDRFTGDVYVKRGDEWLKARVERLGTNQPHVTGIVGRTQPKEGASVLERERKTMDRIQEEAKKATEKPEKTAESGF